jgi:methylmalonyl-CoA/ethylmalonyl-CoA epimerase|tara:strand:+ start:1885 stop:2289 length:405 start_codon:yes stop_codon:yes gene_type:complete
MIKVLGVEHIGVALNKNEQLSDLFKNIFNLEYIGSEVVEDQGVNTDIFNVSNTKIELLESISNDSPISKYISKHGQGMHHIALIVEDINVAIQYLMENNIKMIDKEPKIGVEGYHIAFIHPKSTPGLLIEICQK